MNENQRDAVQLVEDFRLRYNPENFNEDRLRGVVLTGLMQGMPAAHIRAALPQMRICTLSALAACIKVVEEAGTQPDRQRRRRPADFVPPVPIERTDGEVETAQLAFGEMRKTLRQSGAETSRRPQASTESSSDSPPVPPPPPGGSGLPHRQSGQ